MWQCCEIFLPHDEPPVLPQLAADLLPLWGGTADCRPAFGGYPTVSVGNPNRRSATPTSHIRQMLLLASSVCRVAAFSLFSRNIISWEAKPKRNFLQILHRCVMTSYPATWKLLWLNYLQKHLLPSTLMLITLHTFSFKSKDTSAETQTLFKTCTWSPSRCGRKAPD